ncbi:hypothetical protein ACCUM_2398 [Candidatus Accumulibacter phosphatis]|uniref:Uncharacterized protein n=1 Tax=Candidatus Accumulibacter phosphatis TaxID=327160 RepID=A0A5S4ERD0_9PROT|nr:hypothetical protein ACCUM_2398 [Candidatus Accumulibacter phosphatis]
MCKSHQRLTNLPSPHLRERRRGYAEHCSAPPQPARDAARAAGGVGGCDGVFAEHALRPSNDSGVQAGMRPAREGNGHDCHDRRYRQQP